MSRLGERLTELRGNLSLHELGKQTQIAPIDISRYEQGKLLPTPPKLKKLAEYLEVPYEELRILYYEDYFSDPEERTIALKWAKQALNSP